jgi:hypothetical protein
MFRMGAEIYAHFFISFKHSHSYKSIKIIDDAAARIFMQPNDYATKKYIVVFFFGALIENKINKK